MPKAKKLIITGSLNQKTMDYPKGPFPWPKPHCMIFNSNKMVTIPMKTSNQSH